MILFNAVKILQRPIRLSASRCVLLAGNVEAVFWIISIKVVCNDGFKGVVMHNMAWPFTHNSQYTHISFTCLFLLPIVSMRDVFVYKLVKCDLSLMEKVYHVLLVAGLMVKFEENPTDHLQTLRKLFLVDKILTNSECQPTEKLGLRMYCAWDNHSHCIYNKIP